MGVLGPVPGKAEATYTCSDCSRVLPADQYYWHKRGHRHSCACKTCYQLKRRPYQIAYMAGVGKLKRRARYDPDKRSESIVKSYGISLEQYDRLLAAQNGGCAICGSKEAKTQRNGRFCLDHNHQTGEVRGLLCAPCNRGVGLLGDDPERLKKASDYLLTPPSRKAWSC
jgi:hypothetical protein